VPKVACEACGSSDAVEVYEDHTHCYSCGVQNWGASTVPTKTRKLEMDGFVSDLKDRRISKETCEKFGIRVEVGRDGHVAKHYYPYVNTKTGEVVATKKRSCATKDFFWTGDRQDIGLFGQQTCSGSGKYITVTEGELDAAAVSEMFENKWDVVSLPDGAQSARKALQGQLEWLEGYDHVVLCFDQDRAGQEAVDQVKDLFSPNKVKIVELPRKDAGEMLEHREIRKFTRAWWEARSYQPDGIVMVNETWDEVLKYRDTPSVSYPWAGLNDILQGMRTREVVVWAADTGIGKSQTMREIQSHILDVTEDRVGVLMLEESVAKTTLGWMSFHAGRPLHRELNRIPDEELRRYWEQTTSENRLVLLDHNGWNNDFDILKARIRYMAKALDCRWVILDHLHYALSSVQGATGDWAGIDELMTQLVSLALECDIGIHLVCHTSGERNLRGSKGIEKLGDAVIFLERDKHNEDPQIANCTRVVVDKNRWAGDIGTAAWLQYSVDTGRMTETQNPEDLGEF
jgi:twinkle protein